jgi:hypothetical protein
MTCVEYDWQSPQAGRLGFSASERVLANDLQTRQLFAVRERSFVLLEQKCEIMTEKRQSGLADVLFGQSRGGVLALLFGNSENHFYARELISGLDRKSDL